MRPPLTVLLSGMYLWVHKNFAGAYLGTPVFVEPLQTELSSLSGWCDDHHKAQK